MTTSKGGFVGARLAQARKARGITAVSLSEVLQVSTAAISQYEHGRQSPRPELLEQLASHLRVPQAFFFRPIEELGERATKWRTNATSTKAARDRGEARYEWLREIANYFGTYLNFPDLNIPHVPVPEDFRQLTAADIDAAARACRETWGLGFEPVPDLVMLLESNGVIVSRGRLNAEGLDAFSEWLPGERPYVFMGSDVGIACRSRFDAAHELGHLILHRAVTKKQFGKKEDFNILERQAHRFAAAFLLPREQFFRELWAPTLDAFATLKPRWKTSIKGMIVHSHRHGVLNDSQYQRMMINYNRRWRAGEEHDEKIEIEQPRFLARCVEMMLSMGMRSKAQILIDVGVDATDFEELVGLPRGFMSGVEARVISFPTPTPKAVSDSTDGKVFTLNFGRRPSAG